jgi:hypothetical protein
VEEKRRKRENMVKMQKEEKGVVKGTIFIDTREWADNLLLGSSLDISRSSLW